MLHAGVLPHCSCQMKEQRKKKSVACRPKRSLPEEAGASIKKGEEKERKERKS